MGWIALNVGLVMVSILVAWMFVKIFMTEDGERKTGSFLVFLLVFAGVGALGRNYVLPPIETKMAFQKIDEAFAGNVALAALKRHDPTNYKMLSDSIKTSIKERRPIPEITNQAIAVTQGIMRQKLPQASDDATLKYMTLLSNTATRVAERNLNDCYELLHPSASSAQVQVSTYISPQQQQEQFAAMAEVITSASQTPQRIPLESEVKAMVDPMMEELIRLYGKDVLMLIPASAKNFPANSQLMRNAPLPEKSRICQMETAWLRLTLRQPPSEAAKLLRYMVSVSGVK